MKHLKFTLKAWPIVTLLTIGLCYLTQLAAASVGVVLSEQTQVQQVRQMAGASWYFALVIAQVLLLLPVAEEFVFRYLLWRMPSRWAANRPMATWGLAAVSAALFTAAHYLAQPFPDNAFLALYFFGLAQCWLYRKTERIWCPMLNHALFNLVNLTLLFVIPETGGMQ